MIFNVSGGTAAPITTLGITSLPTTQNQIYTFSFILMTPTSTANYITTTSAFNVNGSAVTLKGNTSITFSSTPSYIIQQISVMNISGTLYAFTSANGF